MKRSIAILLALGATNLASGCAFTIKNDWNETIYLVQLDPPKLANIRVTKDKPAGLSSKRDLKGLDKAVRVGEGKSGKIAGKYFFVYAKEPEIDSYRLHFKVWIKACGKQGNSFSMTDIEHGSLSPRFMVEDLLPPDKRSLLSRRKITTIQPASRAAIIANPGKWIVP